MFGKTKKGKARNQNKYKEGEERSASLFIEAFVVNGKLS